MNIRNIGSTALVLVAAACSTDGMGPRGVATGNVGLSFGVLTPGTAEAAKGGLAVVRRERSQLPSFATSTISGGTLVLAAGADTMRLTAVQLTIEEIELERDGQSVDCSADSTSSSSASLRRGRGSDDDSSDDDSSSSHHRGRGSDDCEDHIGGPVFVDLNLAGGSTSQITVPAVLGVYDTLEFDFDVADESSSAHAAYRAAHPEMANASARIIGTFNGAPFELKLDSRLKYEVALTMPLVVSDGTTGFELAINIDVGAWLTRPNGTLVDPTAICSLGSRCTDREIIENNMDSARVRADGRRRGRGRD